MLRRLYAQVLALAASERAPWWLAAIAFAESSFFPIPPDALLIPMALARPARAFRFAAICTLASVAGGMLGYAIGYAFFDFVARPILQFYHYEDSFEQFRVRFAENGVYLILLKGLLPIPFKIVTIASGLSSVNFAAFIAACVVTRGARFFLIAALIRRFGEPVRVFIEERLMLVTSISAACIVLGFVLIRYV
jgi:membrane protein YqaA with SNARE-associated domain